MNKKIAVLKSDKYFMHKPKANKLERPERLEKIYEFLEQNERNYIFVTPEEISDEMLQKTHSIFYINQIREYCENFAYYDYDKDTYLDKNSYKTAKLAVGGCLKIADMIMQDKVSKGFAIVRPPGHHAETGRAMGFCLFNNIAVTAKYLIEEYNLQRILIVDFDAHHGNGTQEIFYNNDKVLTLSIHQNNIFPLSGPGSEIGSDEGEGFNINIPVHPYFGDEEYSYIFGKTVHQVIENFLPQIILVSAGYDSHINDSVSKLEITDNGYATIANFLSYFADKYSDGKLLYILEGGYNMESVYSGVVSSLKALSQQVTIPPGFMFAERAQKIINSEIPNSLKNKWGLKS